jgi:4-amino-4-deoxy-L-arabinose transferase-like glycosyltransferase
MANTQKYAGQLTQKQVTLWLAAIILLAVLLRVGAALYMGDQVQVLPGVYDQISYDTLAQNVAAGRGFTFQTDYWPATRAGEPTAHWSFAYTGFLAGVYGLVGHHPLAVRLIQAVAAGILLPWLVFKLGKRMGSERLGLIAAGISAVYIYFFYYAAALMTETFFMIALLISILMSIDFAHEPGWVRGAGLGLALGVGVLLRQTLLLVMPFMLAWIIWQRRGKIIGHIGGRYGWRYFLAVFSILAALIAPFTIRNYLVFNQFVLLNTNSGFVFFWANHPIHGTNFKSILPAEDPSYQELIPEELRGLDEAALDKALMARGVQFVLDQPLRYALLSISRVRDYFLFWPRAESGLLSNISRVGSFGLFLPFMLYGVILALWPGKLEVRFSGPVDRGIYILVGTVLLVYTGVHLLTWAYVRYRLPIDPLLILFAALAIDDLLTRLWKTRIE